jgi:DNA-directed RNA polymerase subunit K/omega
MAHARFSEPRFVYSLPRGPKQMRLRSAPQTDKETQVIDRLSKRYGRYALVVGVTKRALDLRDRVDSQLEPNEGALIVRAIKEIAGGQVQVQRGAPTEPE